MSVKKSRSQEDIMAGYGWIQEELSKRGAATTSVTEMRQHSVARLVPHTNSFRAPSYTAPLPGGAEEQAGLTDRSRLELRLDLFGLAERPVQGDGNCQFRALADQLYGSEEMHGLVRECVATQLNRHPEWYCEYADQEYTSYCWSISQSGTWGDHLTLQAAADYFQLRIAVVTSFPGTTFLEIAPRTGLRSSRVLWISFWAEVHYNSIYARGETWPAPSPGGAAAVSRSMTAPRVKRPKLLGSRKLHSLLSW